MNFTYCYISSTLCFTGVAFTSNCTQCKAGTFSDSGADKCEICPSNTYSNTGATECVTCSETEYAG